MKIKKIEIRTENKRHFYDISLLVDKPGYISWLLELRKKWKINKLFTPIQYHEFYSHIWNVSKGNWSTFQRDIEEIREKFGRLPNFDEIIIYSLAFTEIPDGIYNSCYLETIIDPSDPDDESKYKYAIIVTPNSTLEDISKVFSGFKRKISVGLKQKKDPKVMEKAVAEYKFELGPNYTPPPRIVENAIRDRNWYWLKKKFSYSVIHKFAKQSGEAITRDGVIKAIKAYTKRLVEI